MVWAKGYRELIDLSAKHKSELQGFGIDAYGNGEDSNEVQSTTKKLDLNINFFKGRDHADDSLHRSVFDSRSKIPIAFIGTLCFCDTCSLLYI